jgi:DNA uptake protein ComE-like DNA-binding protein
MQLVRRDTGSTRGAVLILALLVVIVLTGLALSFAWSMRVEALAAAHRLARAQAAAIARGAAQAVMALGDELPADAVEVGDGAFWLLKPNFDDDRTYAFGIVDEASKVNINTASREMLLALPGMDEVLASAIIDWRDEDSEPSPNGAESDYYLLLPDPYEAKNEALETVEELLLVRDVTAVELYGEDKNRNGVLDDNENDAADSEPPDNRDGTLDRGLIDYVTVYSQDTGEGRINVNGSGGGGGGPGGAPGGAGGSRDGGNPDQEIISVLQEAAAYGLIREDRVESIAQRISAGRTHRNMVDLFYKSGMTFDEFNAVHDQFTTADREQPRSLINVSSAPREVLMAIPGLGEDEADALIAYRLSVGGDTASGSAFQDFGELSSVAWITQVLDRRRAVAIGDYVTASSPRRSVDIVAVSAAGRAFERYRMVFDTSAEEPRVLFWQRLTHLGWPLDPAILEELRKGTPVSDLIQTTNRGSF